jgi:poly(hydroxyalkanoate) granule-associated protein
MPVKKKDAKSLGGANWSSQVRKVLLASVGAVVLAQEEIEDFVEKLVKRGELAEKEGKKLLDDILARRRKQVQKVSKEVANLGADLGSGVTEGIETVLHKVKLVSKRDVDQLSAKIDSLADVVDKLARNRNGN